MASNPSWRIACLVDTNIIIDCLRGRSYALTLLERWAQLGLPAISAVTYLEVYQGMRAHEENSTRAFLDGLAAIVVDSSIAQQVGKMIGEFRSRGVTIDAPDAIIAATALQIGAPVLTNNVEHYPFQGLSVIHGLRA